MAWRHLVLPFILGAIAYSNAMNNGVARTPPMGWLAWERFRCVTDCLTYPDSCISEDLFKEMADRLVEDGWKDAGYNLVNIDDCWAAKERNSQKQLIPDPARFPSGIASLADYMHERGLKLGIYGDYGTHTCGGYPGSMGFEKIDAETFASWGVDMLKFDGCYSTPKEQAVGYPLMSKELNATGRHIIYSCSWPAYVGGLPPAVNYTLLGEICNLWRNYGDIQDSFDDVVDIIGWWGDHQDVLIPAAGPGRWNDPDMLIGGDFSLSYEEAKSQFGMWAMLAAPMFLSNDLRNMPKDFTKMMQTRDVIEINQDPLGIQGRRVKSDNKTNVQLWVRPLVDELQAIAVFSTRTDGTPHTYTFRMSDLGIKNAYPKYLLTDVFDASAQAVDLNSTISVDVVPNGIRMFRASPFTLFRKFGIVKGDIL